MHRCLTVPAPTFRLWVHCLRASDGLLPPRPYLVGYARWDTRSDRFLLARQSFQQLFSSQSALYAGSVVYSWPRIRKPRHSLQEEPRSMLGSLRLTTLTSICIF